MVLTTMGSEVWPRSGEGRLLCVFLAVYAFAVLGYVTRAIATFFVGRDAERPDAELAGRERSRGSSVRWPSCASRFAPLPSGSPAR